MSKEKKPSDADADDASAPPSDESHDESNADEIEPADSAGGSPLESVDRPIGEERDNLRRREEWFRRRSGGGK